MRRGKPALVLSRRCDSAEDVPELFVWYCKLVFRVDGITFPVKEGIP
jgi:hypothetical protein